MGNNKSTYNKSSDSSETKFHIGEYSFDTYEEYLAGREDVKKIEAIEARVNTKDPEVAVRLYNEIREGKISFRSPIGEQFFAHIGDVVADQSVGLLEDKAVVDEAGDAARKQRVIGITLMIIAAISFGIFGIAQIHDMVVERNAQKIIEQRQENAANSASNSATATDSSDPEAISNEDSSVQEAVSASLSVLPEYQDLVNQNSDAVGWLHIDGTDQIDYPVVKRDNEYYLEHAFDGSENKNGTIFMDERCSEIQATTNTILYGHNMKSGMMFGELKKYLQEGFLEEHKYIQFDTIYEKKRFEIVCVGLSQVKKADETGYRYYNFIEANDESEFSEFVENISSLTVFGDASVLTSDDEILTLSTCNSYVENGRLFVVAKRIE